MADKRDDSVSPMTRSPRPESPLAANGSTNGQGDVRKLKSALRKEQSANTIPEDTVPESSRPDLTRSVRSSPEIHVAQNIDAINGTDDLPKALPDAGQPDDISELKSMGGNKISRGPETRLDADPLRVPESTDNGKDNDGIAQGRRSVQFARPQGSELAPTHSRQQSGEGDNLTGGNQGKQVPSLLSKLRALATPISLQGHTRSSSVLTAGEQPVGDNTPTGPLSPRSERGDSRFTGNYDSEADADAEESAGEGPSQPTKKKRKMRRFVSDSGIQTAPTTPRATKMPYFFRDSQPTTPTSAMTLRPPFLLRSATMGDIPEHQRQGVSEDEGRDRLAGRESAWKRAVHRRRNSQETPDGRRPAALRRFTGLGTAHADESSPRPPRGDRTSSISAQKWRQLKAGLKMLGKQKKDESKIDHAKSAELMAELLAGAPAALFFASMFQRDDKGNKRIPILMEQLKLRIVDSERIEAKTGDRHMLFRIVLEYGSGLTRMKWTIHRTLRDFANLHLKYRAHIASEKYIQLKGEDVKKVKLPRFPRSAFPYLRGVRGLADEDESDEDDPIMGGAASGPEGEASGVERPGAGKKRRSSFNFTRRKSSIGNTQPPGLIGEVAQRTGSFAGVVGSNNAFRRETYAERQRKKLELYLQQLISYLIFRAESNRLCKFLELSALGVRLAAEGSYHGKEGYLMIQSGKGMDFRKAWIPSMVVKRHSPKWFIVRHSYIVCVDSPEEMNVYDVFLVDSDFTAQAKKKRLRDSKPQELASQARQATTHPNHHTLRLENSERKLKLLAKNERILHQFEESLRFMVSNTEWAKPHRFNSFAPVRQKVYAQWLVDGRDYMWNVSRAISMARDVIYIHDWWLSPELYMRRPAAISQKWRLDRLLQRKAQEGVKVFVIMYRNINTAIPIDSEYSKFSLLDLHPNVFVQRSPNQIKRNVFFWAHHEKICIVDHTVAFCGGLDLCFGRWDTPQHSVVDDKLTGFEINDMPKDADHCQLWPGKDYSNPRVLDFYNLDKPYEEMYDRTRVPRMPWHDVAMQIVGQPARDLTRHFVQRWNYILRQRKPSRPTPFLLPPPDFVPADIEALGLDGTCEVQVLRSAAAWSIGTPNRVECSIQEAYVKMIQTSQHFVYIENQFFITSCDVEGTKIENLIGDAIVERIKRAHREGEDWRCVVIIPLMPGFQNEVIDGDGSSVRLIMMCQYRSICRGETSIFGRLRDAGIEPEDYIQFYALRSWGKIGPGKAIVTEQLYIHAKCMVVDDRVAIIGSANINERSMLGSRDSEVAVIVRDTEMIPSYMAGEPFDVGKFPHTLRVRLMREHLGLDVDELMEEDCQGDRENWEASDDFHSDATGESSLSDPEIEQRLLESKHRLQDELIEKAEKLHSFNHDVDWEQENNPHLISGKRVTMDYRVNQNAEHEKDVRGEGADKMLATATRPQALGRDSALDAAGREVLLTGVATEGKDAVYPAKKKEKTRNRSNTTHTATTSSSLGNGSALPPPQLPRMNTTDLGLPHLSQLPALPNLDDTDIGGPPLEKTFSSATRPSVAWVSDMRRPVVTSDCMRDPIGDSFFLDTWHAVAENNTRLFRQVFRCQPDSEVHTWKDYKEYNAFSQKFTQNQFKGHAAATAEAKSNEKVQPSGPPGTEATNLARVVLGTEKKVEAAGEKILEKVESKTGSRSRERENSTAKQDGNASSITANATTAAQLSEKAPVYEKDPTAPIPANVLQQTPIDTSPLDEKALKKTESAPALPGVPTTEPFPPAPPIPADDTTTTAAATGTASSRARTVTISEAGPHYRPATTAPGGGVQPSGSTRRRRRGTTKSTTRAFSASDESQMLDGREAETLLGLVQGRLVVFPYDWLDKEEAGAKWLYNFDQIAPLEIYS